MAMSLVRPWGDGGMTEFAGEKSKVLLSMELAMCKWGWTYVVGLQSHERSGQENPVVPRERPWTLPFGGNPSASLCKQG